MDWAQREFGEKYAGDVFYIMEMYFMLNYQRKPEHMGFNEILPPNNLVRDPEFSLYNYGDEVQGRLDGFAEMDRMAEDIIKKYQPQNAMHIMNLFFILFALRC